MKTSDIRNDCKFYFSMILGFILLLVGCFIEPPGEISSSVLIGAGMILTITAGLIGVDLQKIIREFRYLREGTDINKE